MNLKLRKATTADMDMINAIYRKQKWYESTLHNETIIIAESDEGVAGFGRIKLIDKYSCELGGMYVDPKYRGQKIAGKIVRALLKKRLKKIVYCLPYKKFEHVYLREGFTRFDVDDSVPSELRHKLKQYPEATILKRMYRTPLW